MAKIKHLQRVGGLVRLKWNSPIAKFSLLEGEDDFANIERGSAGLYICFMPENKDMVDCEILLYGDKLFAIPSCACEEWFEAI